MTIKERLDAWHEKDRKLTAESAMTLKELKQELDQIQSDCPHEETRYHPDASGNNDSWTECIVCGKELS